MRLHESFLFQADELDLFGLGLNWEQALKAPCFLDGDHGTRLPKSCIWWGSGQGFQCVTGQRGLNDVKKGRERGETCLSLRAIH